MLHDLAQQRLSHATGWTEVLHVNDEHRELALSLCIHEGPLSLAAPLRHVESS